MRPMNDRICRLSLNPRRLQIAKDVLQELVGWIHSSDIRLHDKTYRTFRISGIRDHQLDQALDDLYALEAISMEVLGRTVRIRPLVESLEELIPQQAERIDAARKAEGEARKGHKIKHDLTDTQIRASAPRLQDRMFRIGGAA
jgi:hypothetical protein